MAPRRNTTAGSLAEMHNLLINPDSDLCSDPNLSSTTDSLATSSAASSPTSMRDVAFLKMLSDMENLFPKKMNGQLSVITQHQPTTGPVKSFVQLQCCIPIGMCKNANSMDFGLINLDDLSDCVRMLCTNEHCAHGQYMHRDCFNMWEQMILQKLNIYEPFWKKMLNDQAIWTQDNYPTIFRMCQCKCGGFLRKDLDWCPPSPSLLNISGQDEVDNNNNVSTMKSHSATTATSSKKKNKGGRKNQKPILSISTLNQSNGYLQNFPSLGPNGTSSPLKEPNGFGHCWANKSFQQNKEEDLLESRSGSVLSSDLSLSPIHNSPGSSFNNSAVKSVVKQQQSANKSKTEIYSDRIRWVFVWLYSDTFEIVPELIP